jgi:hypothetical protein
MHPLAHHAGEQTLAPLLLLTGGGFTLFVAYSREHLASVRARLTRKQEHPRPVWSSSSSGPR